MGERTFKSTDCSVAKSSKQIFWIKIEFAKGLDDVLRLKDQGLEKQRHLHYHVVNSAIAHSVSFEEGSNDSSSQMFDLVSYSTSDDRDLLVMEGYVSEKFFVDNLAEQNLQVILE